MEDQMTAERAAAERIRMRNDFNQATSCLVIGLPLYAAIAMAAVTALLVAVPLLALLARDQSGLARYPYEVSFQIDFLFFTFVPIVFVPGAAALALGMRAMLKNMLRSGAALAGRERSVLGEAVTGMAILNTAFLALMFMRPFRPSNLLRSVLLGAVAASAILFVSFLVWTFVLLFGVLEYSGALWIYFGAYALFALTLCAAVAVPMWQMMSRGHGKLLSLVVLTAAACGLATGALFIPLPGYPDFMTFGTGVRLDLVFLASIFLAFLFMPPLLRAGASYARLRHDLRSSPEG